MCLRVSTARRPLFTTAYKILERQYNMFSQKYEYVTPYLGTAVDLSGKWITDERPGLLKYSSGGMNYIGVGYKTGFHSYVHLKDAIEKKRIMTHSAALDMYALSLYVFEVDTDDIVEYGVEGRYDVVVSRKIRFVQEII